MKRKITIEVNTETSGITIEYGKDMSAELVLGILRLAMLHEEEQLRDLWREKALVTDKPARSNRRRP